MSAFQFPDADAPSLTDTPALRWGIVGTGQIAGDFADALYAHTAQKVVAVTSRTTERAESFRRSHGVDRFYTDASSMAEDPEVDIVYVATPHDQHFAGALAAITAGTPVLIEKPLGLSAGEAEAIAQAATDHGVLAAEGMWTSYQPGFRVLRKMIDEGDLGDVLLAHADIGWAVDLQAGGRILDPAAGGGALLDMGIYSLWFAQFATGHPASLAARGTLRNGIDLDSAALLTGESGALATATSTIRGTMDGLATITGTRASVRFLDHFVFPGAFSLSGGDASGTWSDPHGLTGRSGLAHEAVAIASYVLEGRTSSPLHGLADSISLARTMDSIRNTLNETATPSPDGTLR